MKSVSEPGGRAAASGHSVSGPHPAVELSKQLSILTTSASDLSLRPVEASADRIEALDKDLRSIAFERLEAGRRSRSLKPGNSFHVFMIYFGLNSPFSRGELMPSSQGILRLAISRPHDLLTKYRNTPSMSRKGDCWDNAVTESSFGTLKTELGDPVWATREAARAAIFEYIEVWYNRRRLHSSNRYLSPEQFERNLARAA